jgi:hypothetical protein
MGHVYIYRSGHGNVFKIGKATDLEKRLKAHASSEYPAAVVTTP